MLTGKVTEELLDLGDTKAFRRPTRQFTTITTTTTIVLVFSLKLLISKMK